MPRLAKGGKWVYSWVVISAELKMPIPPEAWQEYGFQAGSQVLLLRGSRLALGLVARGPIYEKATRHPELTELS